MTNGEQLQKIRLLSDTELYEQATKFIQGFIQARRRSLPGTQLHGLADIVNSDSYTVLVEFVEHQQSRNWSRGKEYIGAFYDGLREELRQIEKRARVIFQADLQGDAQAAQQELLMALLVREYVQHMLAEHAYLDAKRKNEEEERRRTSDGNRR